MSMSPLGHASSIGIKENVDGQAEHEKDSEGDESEYYDECPVNISHFDLIKRLGAGTFGTVFLAKKNCGIDADRLYALKVIHKAKIVNFPSKDILVIHLRAERRALEILRHCPYVQKLYYAFESRNELFLVTDYVPGGEMFTLMTRGELPEHQVRFYMAELIVALEHIHKHGIAFRDIKAENVLIDADGHIKLVDFGLCKKVGSRGRTYTFCGTKEYMAPEIIDKTGSTGYNTAVDWWALGVLAAVLLSTIPPFGWLVEGNDVAIYNRILEEDPIMPENISEEMKDILRKLLTKDPASRLGGSELAATVIKQHRLFNDIDWEQIENKQLPSPFVPTITHPCDTQNFSEEFTQQPASYESYEMPPDSLLSFEGYSFIAPELNSTLSNHRHDGLNAYCEPDSMIVSNQRLVEAYASKVQNQSDAETPKCNEHIQPNEVVIPTADENDSKFEESQSKNTVISGSVAQAASKKRNQRKSLSVEPTMHKKAKLNNFPSLDPLESLSLLNSEEIKIEQRELRTRKSIDSAQTTRANKRSRKKSASVHKNEMENERIPLPRNAKTKRTEKPKSKLSGTTSSGEAQPSISEPVKSKPIDKTTPKLPEEHSVPNETLKRQPREKAHFNLTEEMATSPVKSVTDQATQTDYVPNWSSFNKPMKFEFYCFEQINYKKSN